MHTFSELRRAAGYTTQEALGVAAGSNRDSVAKWETGAAFPRVPTLYRLSQLLGVPMDEVVRAIEASRRPEG